jgi:hypothetical protein
MTMLQQGLQPQSPDANCPGPRSEPEGPSILFDEMRQCADQGVALLNVAGICPVCGNFYQPGESVVALAALSVLAGAVAFAASGHEHDGKIILGHQDCVVPRLLSLLARVHRKDRFAGAAEEAAVSDSVFPEGHYGTA